MHQRHTKYTSYTIRKPAQSELPALAQLWYDGWQEAHAAHEPASLTAIRMLDSFETRQKGHFDTTGGNGASGTTPGLCITKSPEIYQIFVSAKAQGTGAASLLITDGLSRIRAAGHTNAKLDVNTQNARAIAFYEKMGWQRKGVETIMLDTLTEPYPLQIGRASCMERMLR